MLQFTINKIRAIYEVLRESGKLAPMAIVMLCLPIIGLTLLLGLLFFISPWLRENQELGSLLFALGFTVFSGLAILPTNSLGILGGWSFGLEIGLISVMSGLGGAALVSYFIHSRLFGNKLTDIIGTRPKAAAIYKALTGKGFWHTTLIVALVRLSPMAPFAVTNFLMSTAKVPVGAFFLGTILGMFPRTAAMVFIGSELSTLDFSNPKDTWILLIGIFGTIIAVAAITIIGKQTLAKLTAEVTEVTT